MKTNEKNKAIFGISIGSLIIIAFYIYFYLTGTGLDQLESKEILLSIFTFSLVLLIYGSSYYAHMKGYTFLYGFVSIMFPFGLLLLLLLKNKNKNKKSERVASCNQSTAPRQSGTCA